MSKKLKEFSQKKLKELLEKWHEIDGPEAWWSPSFGHYAGLCLVFGIFCFILESYTIFWICIGIFTIWFVNFLLE